MVTGDAMRLPGLWILAVFAGLLSIVEPASAQMAAQDTDQDGYADEIDDCPAVYNPFQNGVCIDDGRLQSLQDTLSSPPTFFYDVDFGTPPHAVGRPPVVDSFRPAPRKAPSSINFGTPTVVAAEGVMDQQPLRFGSGMGRIPVYDQVGFGIQGSGFDGQLSHYHFELTVMLVSDYQDKPSPFTILFDTPSADQIRLLSNGVISAINVGASLVETEIGRWEPGVPLRVVVDIERNQEDLRNSHWTIALDGEEVLSAPLRINLDFGMTALRVSARQFVVAAIDDVIVTDSPIRFVDIDIKPESDPNPLNPSLAGILPVVILGSDRFDVADVDATTLAFGRSGASLAHLRGPHPQDVNDDGVTNLLMHYRVEDAGIEFGDMQVCVTGETLGGAPFKGCDAIRTVPDMDGDDLPDVEEAAIGTDALNPDTDGDGFDDGQEVLVMGTHPLNSLDPAPLRGRNRRGMRRY